MPKSYGSCVQSHRLGKNNSMKQFFLLLNKFTYIYVPKKWQAGEESLPKAVRFLPLLGLLVGALLYLASRLLDIMPNIGAAAALLGLNLFFGGAILLRSLITVADGLAVNPLYPPQKAAEEIKLNPLNEKELKEKSWRFNAGRAGLVWGLVWLLALYFLYLWYFYDANISNFVFFTAPVLCRWLMCWLIYYFYAVPPAWLHRNFSRKDFIVATIITMAILVPFSRPALYLSILISVLGILIFATYRQRNAGGLDDPCYGAACAWAEILFLLTWMTVDRFF